MLRKILCLALAVLLINLGGALSVQAVSKEEKQARFAEGVKAGIARLGTGADARIEVKLRDKTKLRGYLSEANEEGFVVVDAKSGVATKVSYGQVAQVKGNNLSTGVKIAIGIAVGLALAILVAVALTAAFGGGS